MVSRLVKAMGALSQVDDDDTNQEQQRRKSARLSNRRRSRSGGSTATTTTTTTKSSTVKEDELLSTIHDSGTESEEEEMESIALHQQQIAHFDPFSFTYASYNQFLSGGSPPNLTASPPVPKDVDTESWDSFGRESGIMTGDNDSDTDGAATPTPLRRRVARGDDDTSSVGGEKRRHSMTMNDHPIAWRLRSFTTEPVRPVKIAARRAPVRIIINRPLAQHPKIEGYQMGGPVELEIASPELIPAPAPKRNRRNSHRPSLDFEKMVENRIDADDDDVPQKPTTRSSH